MEDRETVIADCRAVMEALTDCSRIDGEAEEASSEMEVVAGMIQRLVDENATRKLDQEDYRSGVRRPLRRLGEPDGRSEERTGAEGNPARPFQRIPFGA